MATSPKSVLIGCSIDTDGDGVFDYLDLDSDNDGIADAIEACGIFNLTLEDCMLDNNGDALYPDDNGDGCPDGVASNLVCESAPIDTDNDDVPDFRDLDSDGDCCADSIEAGTQDFGTSGDIDYVSGPVDICGLLLTGISGNCPNPIGIEWIDVNDNFACCPADYCGPTFIKK